MNTLQLFLAGGNAKPIIETLTKELCAHVHGKEPVNAGLQTKSIACLLQGITIGLPLKKRSIRSPLGGATP
jgi:hypothetical protein